MTGGRRKFFLKNEGPLAVIRHNINSCTSNLYLCHVCKIISKRLFKN